jgi:hypothetical protein
MDIYTATEMAYKHGYEKGYADGYMGHWIPVTERVPEQGQEVIVFSGGVLKPRVFAYHFWCKDYTSFAHITHWMPLPEPPKEGA